MKRATVRAYAVDTTGLYFWAQNAEKGGKKRIDDLIKKEKNAVTEKEARRILGNELLQILKSSGVLKSFLIMVTDCGKIETATDGMLECIEEEIEVNNEKSE